MVLWVWFVSVYVVYVPALHPIHFSEMFFVLVLVGMDWMICVLHGFVIRSTYNHSTHRPSKL